MTAARDGRARVLAPETWFGFTDARPLALLRIAIGLILIEDWIDRLRDLSTFLGDSGIVPLGRSAGAWSLFDGVKSPTSLGVLYGLGLVAIVAFTCGYRTRLSTLLTWAFVYSAQTRNLLICDSGDTLIRTLLFWGLFVDLGARFSLDVRLRRRPPARWIPVLGVRFMQMQIALMYLVTALAKSGSSWADGTAIQRALLNPDFGRPTGIWLAGMPWLCHLMTHATRAIEGGFPVLVFLPWCQPWARRAGVLAGTLLHLGIFVFMKVGFFSPIVIASYLVFVDGPALDRVARSLRRLRAEGDETAPPPHPYAEQLCLLLLCQFLLIIHSQIHAASDPEVIEMNVTGTWQNWRMFAPNPPAVSYHFSSEGIDGSGVPVDVLAAVAPAFAARGGFRYTRWNKLRSNLEGTTDDPNLAVLGRYICDRYNRETSRLPLKSFDLYVDITRLPVAHLPLDAQDQTLVLRLRQSC